MKYTSFYLTLLFSAITLAITPQSVSADTNWTLSGTTIYNTNSGNIGIGTTSPATKLEINGSQRILRLTSSSSYAGLQINGATNNDSNVYLTEGGTDKYIIGWSGSNDYLRFYDYGDSSTDMIIKTNGDIGIGTTSPSARLDVVGSHRILKISDPSSYAGLQINGGNGYDSNLYFSEGGADKYIIGWDADQSSLRFIDGTNTDLIIDSSGNLGIGTTTPTKKLDVAGEAAFDGALFARDATGIGLKDDGGNTGVWIEDGGQVGIGTTSPESHLHIKDNNYAEGENMLQIGDDTYFADMDDAGTLRLNTTSTTNPMDVRLELGAAGAAVVGKNNGDICIGNCN